MSDTFAIGQRDTRIIDRDRAEGIMGRMLVHHDGPPPPQTVTYILQRRGVQPVARIGRKAYYCQSDIERACREHNHFADAHKGITPPSL